MVSIYNAIWIVHNYIKREEMRKKMRNTKNKTAVYKVFLKFIKFILSYLITPQRLLLTISWASAQYLLYPHLTTITFTVLFYHKNKTAVLFFLHFLGVSVTCWSNLRVLSVIFNLLTSETENMLQKTKGKLMSLFPAHDATDRAVCGRQGCMSVSFNLFLVVS